MRVFETGGSGFIGAAVIPEPIANGHRVLALARSDANAATLAKAGADVHRAELGWRPTETGLLGGIRQPGCFDVAP